MPRTQITQWTTCQCPSCKWKIKVEFWKIIKYNFPTEDDGA